MYLDGQKNGVFNKHSLALCYLFGPVGFLSHLLTRTAFSVIKPGVRDIMEVRYVRYSNMCKDFGACRRSESILGLVCSGFFFFYHKAIQLIISPTDEQGGGAQQPKPAAPRAPSRALPTPSSSGEAKEILANARREADAILNQARSEGGVQAASLLEVRPRRWHRSVTFVPRVTANFAQQ